MRGKTPDEIDEYMRNILTIAEARWKQRYAVDRVQLFISRSIEQELGCQRRILSAVNMLETLRSRDFFAFQ